MSDPELSSMLVIQRDVRDTVQFIMPRNINDRQRRLEPDGCIDNNYPFDASLDQQPRVFLQQIVTMQMTRGEVKIAFFCQDRFNAIEHHRGISIAQFRYDHAECVSALD